MHAVTMYDVSARPWTGTELSNLGSEIIPDREVAVNVPHH